MLNQDLHKFLFSLYDFTDHIADQAESDSSQESVRILALIFIEQYFDSIGRGEISVAARECDEIDSHQSLSEAHKRIDVLRSRINALVTNCESPERIEKYAQQTMAQWLKKNETYGK
jgi:hydroxypyruvate isomerase